ncbi:putative conjugative transfer protein [Burkholderia contaminans]|uniref:type-F conjugative transfer system pilin assembly protein TrbC n=1 Tax=Burkholderia contaminans TaxID=488447 RepID=UPI001453748C|nr:type-F conjugative transfer system pilin assembly protein TrbC [Burkholderia contaminans]VWC93313.1 putative conjugative transfer protein [Burkholderia contaminans]
MFDHVYSLPFSKRALTLMLGALIPVVCLAQGVSQRMPSDERIATERARIEAERKPMFADPNLGRSATGNAFPAIPTPPRAQVDPLAVAQRYTARAQSRKQEELLAFASLSMPAESLKRLVRDVARAGGAVVLRGFRDGSMKTTAAAIQALGVDASAVQINPNAFKQYRITAVPAIVLVKADRALDLDAEGCSLPANFAGVIGDVTVPYALREIGRRSPEYQTLADRMLAGLGEH